MDKIFFDNWQSIVRTFTITILAYLALVMLLRTSGKRTLAKMNAYDFVITIALGSALSTVALNKNIALADGFLAFFLFIMLQFSLSWLAVRFKKLKGLLTSQPVLLLYHGQVLHTTLRKERISVEELYVAARKSGCGTLENIDAMVLETTGDITVMANMQSAAPQTLNDVQNLPR